MKPYRLKLKAYKTTVLATMVWLLGFCPQVKAFQYTWDNNGKISDIELPEDAIYASPDYRLGDPLPLSFSQALNACLLAVGPSVGGKTNIEFIRFISQQVRGSTKFFFVVSWSTGSSSSAPHYALVLLNGKVFLPK